ncbi:Helix-turn-helix domain-containing protein [Streptomyces sp. KS_16]|nr:helix-turn-helix protein [Streptomyces sp. 2321.6]SDR50381.1 Helix-turn-helix domain-containing protein [Streptomyces sp. KS_16]SEC52092.1 Helix-turn-helix domain-containing protein [Streptomyces sp. 2133.1]SNC68042.1 Helix-turn-helix domain-containing protein [Streptomyces sp. 2114.4]
MDTPLTQPATGPAGHTASRPAAPRPAAAPRDDAARRAELAAFLRSRRERITPEQVGLPRGTRRRTPGLRREEVAHLGAVGVTWYTWLEQARDIHVSPQVLDAVARALLLDRAERSHLFALAGAIDPTPGTECTGVTRELRQMLRQLEPFPAVLQNSRFDILAYNATYGRLMCDLDALPEEDRNCMWLAFTHAEWRASVVDLDATMRVMAAKFRASMAEHVAEPAWKALVARLTEASSEFREIWAQHEVIRPMSAVKLFRHPRVGTLQLSATSLWTGPNPGPKLLSYTPVDEVTRERLELLAAEAAEAARSARSAEPPALVTV